MSDAAIIVTAICSVITAIGVPLIALFMALLNSKQTAAAAEVKEVKKTLKMATEEQVEKLTTVAEKVDEVHKATNSLTDRLIETTRTESFAAGIKEEKERDKK